MANAEQALPPGYRIGAYEVTQLLGAGTFGNVYLCRHREDGDLVAVREYMPFDTATRGDDMAVRASLAAAEAAFQDGLAVFRDRARRMASADHPNLVRVREQLEVNGTVYVVMDYAQGRRLSQLVPEAAALEEEQLGGYLRPIAEGLMAMHEAGVVHGSLGLDSIVVTDEGVPQLLGLAVPARDAFGAVAKPGFAPIEQYSASDDLASPRTDVYSLGAVLYRCVTGLTPPEAPIRAERDTLVPAARTRGRSRYSAALLAAIDAALTLDPEGRPERIEVLRDALPSVTPSVPEERDVPPEERPDATQAQGQEEPATRTSAPAPVRGARGRIGGTSAASKPSRKVLLGGVAAGVVVAAIGLVALLGGGDGDRPDVQRDLDEGVPQEEVASEPAEPLTPLPEAAPGDDVAAPEVAAETAPLREKRRQTKRPRLSWRRSRLRCRLRRRRRVRPCTSTEWRWGRRRWNWTTSLPEPGNCRCSIHSTKRWSLRCCWRRVRRNALNGN